MYSGSPYAAQCVHLPVLYPVDCTALWNEAPHHQSFLQWVSHSHPTAGRDLNTTQQLSLNWHCSAEQADIIKEMSWHNHTKPKIAQCKEASSMTDVSALCVIICLLWLFGFHNSQEPKWNQWYKKSKIICWLSDVFFRARLIYQLILAYHRQKYHICWPISNTKCQYRKVEIFFGVIQK